jgi:hypothetical protein
MVVTFVVAFPAHADATCAWVLWKTTDTSAGQMKRLDPDLYGTSPIEVYDSRAACETAAETQSEKEYRASVESAEAVNDDKAVPLVRRVEHVTMGHVVRMFERSTGKVAGWASFFYRCFPDTIDPRAAKGAR